MLRLFFKLAFTVFVSFIAFSTVTTLVSAHTISSTSVKRATIRMNNTPLHCAHLFVHLNGKSSSKKCLDDTKHGASPFTYVTDCGPHTLLLTWDYYGQGYSICFLGSGFANMTDYYGPWYDHRNWNDQASYYDIGCSSGTFFADINGQGARQTFVSFEQYHNFDGGTSWSGQKVLNNDTLSSLSLNSNCT